MIKANDKKTYALQTAAKFLLCVSKGAPATPEEFKLISDLCWLALKQIANPDQ